MGDPTTHGYAAAARPVIWIHKNQIPVVRPRSHNFASMDLRTLTTALDEHDHLLCSVAAGGLSFDQFLRQYDNFYWAYALDGHEAEPGEAVLAALAPRIEPHRRVAEEVLSVVAAEPLTGQPAFQSTGRIGPAEAIERLKLIAWAMPTSGA